MRKFLSAFAVAAVTGLASLASPSSAASVAGGLALSGAAPLVDDGIPLVHKVHGSHCSPRKGWYRGKTRVHRHSRACRFYDDFDDFNLRLGGSRDFYVHGRYRGCHSDPADPYRFCHYGPGDEF